MPTSQADRNARARRFGFDNDYQLRQWIKANKEAVEAGKPYVMEEDGSYNPQQAKEYWDWLGQYKDVGRKPRKGSKRLGTARHFAIKYFMDWEGYEFEDAYEAMQDIYGDSGEEEPG